MATPPDDLHRERHRPLNEALAHLKRILAEADEAVAESQRTLEALGAPSSGKEISRTNAKPGSREAKG
jgi:hypothetical protein